jgi:hypothetical protein
MLDESTIKKVAANYPANEEAKDERVLCDAFRRPILQRGYLTAEELLSIADWKSPRPKPRLRNNSPDLIQSITRDAFAAQDPLRAVKALDQLQGVAVRMASAILTVYDPQTYTVLDQRAWRSLERMGYVAPPKEALETHLNRAETYVRYLGICKRLAVQTSVLLRMLDRCLWTLNGQIPAEFFSTAHRV